MGRELPKDMPGIIALFGVNAQNGNVKRSNC